MENKYPIVKNGNIELNVEGFIIPNSFNKPSDFLADFVAEDMRQHIRSVYADNNLSDIDDPDTVKCAEMWFTSPQYGFDNMYDHGFMVTTENGEDVMCYFDRMGQYIPCKILQGKNEGNAIQYIVDAHLTNHRVNRHESDTLVKLILNVTLAQNKYRYRNFGPFEKCFDSLGGNQ